MVYSNDCVKSGIPPFGKRNYEIFSSRIDGTDRVRQTNTKSDELYPVWSRSGKRIAFISQNHTTEPYHTLFTMAMEAMQLCNSVWRRYYVEFPLNGAIPTGIALPHPNLRELKTPEPPRICRWCGLIVAMSRIN